MATPPVPTIEPDAFAVGDSLSWTRNYANYPASDGWTLTYFFVNSTAKFSIVATTGSDGASFSVSVPVATTQGYAVGDYYWDAYLTSGTSRVRIDNGRISVLTNLASVATFDGRTHVKKVLDAIQSTMEGTATREEQNMMVDGLQLGLRPLHELIALESRYKRLYQQEVAAENVRRQKGNVRRINVRFTRP